MPQKLMTNSHAANRKHTVRFQYLLIVVLTTLAVIYLVYAVLNNTVKEFTVTKTERGFVPSKIVINTGDTIIFTSKEEKPFWPASDSHPTHGVYPQFDSTHAISPGESWSFRFDTPGVWGFHDHLDSRFTGRIIVRGEPGKGREECLKEKRSTDLAPMCWEADVTDTLSKDGLSAAFALVDSFYADDPAFRRNCHDVMHILGAAAFREFRNSPVVTAEKRTSYCGYGFYHGFIETMLVENGNSNFDAVKKYCAQLRTEFSPSAAGPCFHGIGHAIFDSLPGTLWGSAERMTHEALRTCEGVLTADEERAQCASGVYNSLANALSARTYDISFSDIEVARFCEEQKPLYQKTCYGELGIGYIREKHMERDTALSFIRSLPADVQPSQVFFYFADETKRMMHSLDVAILASACASLKNGGETHSCIDGVLQGFREATHVAKTHDVALPFCAAFSDDSFNNYCVTKTIQSTSVQVLKSTLFQNECRRYARPASRELCENI
ncbi:hypothetical protein K2X83_01070 [Patescibacteria group bacterium]|nr:hypothetical protein [Patescibacteria group bacterium]